MKKILALAAFLAVLCANSSCVTMPTDVALVCHQFMNTYTCEDKKLPY